MEQPKTTAMAAKVHFFIPDGLTPDFSDVSFVFHTDTEFRLSFYASIVPAFGAGQAQPLLEQDGETFNVVQAKCVAQIVLTPNHAKKLLDALQTNYTAFIEGQGK